MTLMETDRPRRVRRPVKRHAMELAALRWLADKSSGQTRATNQQIAQKLGVALDEGRTQSRRLNEALASLRNCGYIKVTRETPHPTDSPAGRVIVLTDEGRKVLEEETEK